MIQTAVFVCIVDCHLVHLWFGQPGVPLDAWTLMAGQSLTVFQQRGLIQWRAVGLPGLFLGHATGTGVDRSPTSSQKRALSRRFLRHLSYALVTQSADWPMSSKKRVGWQVIGESLAGHWWVCQLLHEVFGSHQGQSSSHYQICGNYQVCGRSFSCHQRSLWGWSDSSNTKVIV